MDMEYIPSVSSEETQHIILCCDCGVGIQPNPSNMCVPCLRKHVDITEGIPKQATLHFCKGCERYLHPPSRWLKCSLESRELLQLCLNKLKELGRVKLVDAGFVWTEPHSKRIKLKLKIQKSVIGNAILQQEFIVEFQVSGQMCEDCHRTEAKDFWRALVQVRQKTDHKKTFFYLEQLILKHQAHANTLGIKAIHDGVDFYFATKQDALKMMVFIESVVPSRSEKSKQLISHDSHSNTHVNKFTFSIDIVPICKDNIVCLPVKLARSLGGISPICICSRITEKIHLIDPRTAQVAEMNGSAYWREPFRSICGPKQLQKYVVMDVEQANLRQFPGQGATSEKHVVADVWLVKANELGQSDAQFHCRTHLGHLLKPMDLVLGFDVTNSNVNDGNFDKLKAESLPDVIIVKKIYADSAKRARKRHWKLKRMNADAEGCLDSNDRDFNEFMEDLEDDPQSRRFVNIYADRSKTAVDMDETDDEEIPRITLQEMLEDFHISEDAMME